MARVSLIDGSEELWILEGVNNLIVAADIIGDGHITDYPSDKTTIALQIPFKEGQVPKHRVIQQGVCPLSSQHEHGFSGDASQQPLVK